MSTRGDRALLRRFEPVIRYTRGERFFPMDVEPYVRACSLWVQRADEDPACLIPEGELTMDNLAEPRVGGFETVYFLRFNEPLNVSQLAVHNLQSLGHSIVNRDAEDVFRAGRGRLARVGYLSRFVDAIFSLSLLARGRVPGDAAAAAIQEYQRILAQREHYCYYGRVVRESGWVALQYWFFYAFNDWRSRFYGANDHEADWEMVYVYLSESDAGEVRPEWVAYASHDCSGDDLRRRWDDPELEKVEDHPVIYAGAGSHASYYRRGEYLTELEIPYLSPLARWTSKLQKLWRENLSLLQEEPAGLGQPEGRKMPESRLSAGDDRQLPGQGFSIFRVPFVDYARGDGLSIGPGQDREWDEPCLLDPTPGWALHYRGLWGLYTRDPAAGEDAPAGPLYDRDGTIRRSWCDPLGWAGLDKVPPPDEVQTRLREQQAEIAACQAELEATIARKSRELTDLGIEAAAMRGHPHLEKAFTAHQEQIATRSEELAQARAQLAAGQTLLEAMDLYDARLQDGERDPVRAHIRRAHQPASDSDLRFSRFAELWAAVSIALMIIGFVVLVAFYRQYLLWGLVALVSLFVFVESGFRGQLSRLVASVTIGLAVIAALVLLYEFFWPTVVLAVLVVGVYIMRENLRELL